MSTDERSAAEGESQWLTSLLGTTRPRALLERVAESFAIGLAVVLVALAAAYHPQPHNLAVGIVPSQVTTAVSAAVAHLHPGAYRFVNEPSNGAAIQAIRTHSTWGAMSTSSHSKLFIAGANGPTVTANLIATFTPAFAAAGYHAFAVDVLPSNPGDSGTSLFYIAFGTLLGGYLLAISSFTRARSLPARSHLLTSAMYSVVMGVVVSAISTWWLDVTPGRFVVVALIVALLGMAAGSATYLFLSISRSIGTVIAAIALLAIANTAGGVLPPPFLPPWLVPASYIFPQGIALSSLKGAVYFGGAGLVEGLLGLGLWVVVPIVAVKVVSRGHTQFQTRETLAPSTGASG